MTSCKIGQTPVGNGSPCFIIAEIGINHNGDLELAKRLIDLAVEHQCNAVKFQKRTVDVVYSVEELAKPRENPFGTTNGDLKRGLEFGEKEYQEIDAYCRARGIHWTASCWDEASVDFIDRFEVPFFKIASASLTDDGLLRHTRERAGRHRPILLSVGMSTMAQVDHAVEVLGKENLILLHTCSAYPAKPEDLNLRVIPSLIARFALPVGYSGHETGISTSVAAVALGACVVERHITWDRAMWGSDQAASLGPNGLSRLVRDIRLLETSLGSPEKRLLDEEIPVMHKLRRVGA